jgi:hypothetical protein
MDGSSRDRPAVQYTVSVPTSVPYSWLALPSLNVTDWSAQPTWARSREMARLSHNVEQPNRHPAKVFETDVLAGFVLAQVAAGLSDGRSAPT